MSLWAQIGAVMDPDAQGALTYFFLPMYLLGLIPLGYAGGRLTGHLVFRHPAPPPGRA